MSDLVEKNDYIKFDPDSRELVTVRWQQELSNRSEEYVVVPYTVIGKSASGILYIQKSYADEFMNKSEKDESTNSLVSGSSKIKVDDAFQYGQNRNKTLRFLVYHNKTNHPYQFRLIFDPIFFGIVEKIVKSGREYGGLLWGEFLSLGWEQLKSYVGDNLDNF